MASHRVRRDCCKAAFRLILKLSDWCSLADGWWWWIAVEMKAADAVISSIVGPCKAARG